MRSSCEQLIECDLAMGVLIHLSGLILMTRFYLQGGNGQGIRESFRELSQLEALRNPWAMGMWWEFGLSANTDKVAYKS